MRNLCAILAAVLIFSCASVGRAQGPQENIQPNSGYPDSEDGFRTQFNAVLKAYCSGDRAQGISLLDGLRLPDSADWFAQNFEPNEAPKLSGRYDQFATEYLASMERTIEDICMAPGATLTIRLDDKAPSLPSSLPPSVLAKFKRSEVRPLHELTLVRFILEIKVKDRYAGGWENVFSYEKGNFRFIGAGAWPFWTWEDSSDGLGIFVKRGYFNWPLEVIHQVPPEYPQSARKQHIQGVVELAITVDKDGMVTKADALKGDPLLVDAAITAVKKWRFKAVPAGGDPIEARGVVNIAFQPGR